jgi:hypothetical protein
MPYAKLKYWAKKLSECYEGKLIFRNMLEPFLKELSEPSPFLPTGNIKAYERDKNSPSKPEDEDRKSNWK